MIGAEIERRLKQKKWTKQRLAEACRCQEFVINLTISEEWAVWPSFATKLAEFLGETKEFWIELNARTQEKKKDLKN